MFVRRIKGGLTACPCQFPIDPLKGVFQFVTGFPTHPPHMLPLLQGGAEVNPQVPRQLQGVMIE
eukprot:4598180-Alexandrium_andersonii.AAC.1